MKGLNSTMRIAIRNGWLKGFKLNDREDENLEICQLLYADDTVIFCEPSVEQISCSRVILLTFEAVSSLSLKGRKNSLFPIKEVTQMQGLANILGCRIEQLPIVYLGMPLGNKHKDLEIWDGIIEKTKQKLAMWKSQYLSLGRRLILINAV